MAEKVTIGAPRVPAYLHAVIEKEHESGEEGDDDDL